MKTLIEFQNYYYEHLCNRSFVFETDIGRIVLRFSKSNFAHLIGLHHFDSSYKGQLAWNQIANGSIDLKKLKKSNNNLYKNTLLPRIDVIDKVLGVFNNTKTIKKFKKLEKCNKGFDCDFVFYDNIKKQYYVITCFIDKNTKSYCSAASFLKFYNGDFKVMKYINPSNPEIRIYEYKIMDAKVYNDINFEKFEML